MESLRILLGNNTLANLAGSETWTRTLAIQLKKMGHKVECFSPELGIISEQLSKEGIPSFKQITGSGIQPFSFVLEEPHDFKYDVIISNHHHIVDYLRSCFPKIPIISTIHGIMHTTEDGKGGHIMAPEHPALEAGVNQFVAVSDEVQDMLKKLYSIDAMIVRNFFDLENFKVKRKPSPGRPQVFLINTSYADSTDPEIKLIREIAKDHYKARTIAIGQNFNMTPDIMKPIEEADVVIGMGRSVLEGVAAGRLGIVHGRWGTGGVIHEGNIDELRACNFSGRNARMKYHTKEQLIAEIDAHYNPRNLAWGADYIKQNHNVVFAAESYIQMARTLLGQDIVRPEEVPLKPYRRAKDVKPN